MARALNIIISAWTVARVILFKYLCDRLEVPCKISLREVSPSFTPTITKIQHGVAWVRSGNIGTIDLLGRVGTLYEEDVAKYYEEVRYNEFGNNDIRK